ncbi:hypothetical protein TrCOL_g4087, partial [Triparma columacea]
TVTLGGTTKTTFKEGAIFTGLISFNTALKTAGVISTGTVTAGGVALTSDRRYKKNINTVTTPLASVMKLRGVTYDWRTDEFPEKNFDNHTHFGFIAQEVEEVIPEFVGTNDLGFKSIRYMGFTSLLVEALKEQQGVIDELRGDVIELRTQLDTLQKQVEELLKRNKKL